MTEPIAAADDCEHHYATRILGGRPLHVRACTLCHVPDWADLDEQAAEIYRWGWEEGRAGKAPRETLSAYDKPQEAIAAEEEQPAPVDWEAIVKRRERELKQVGEARHRAEIERDEARQHAAAIAAQRDRLRQRMNTLSDRWDHALAPDKPYARTLRAEITCDPFHPEASLVVQQYRADDGSQKWAFRCWGTDTCDGRLSLDHSSQQSAERARDRHVAEEHAAPRLDEPQPEERP